MIPPYPGEATSSRAERKVFRLLDEIARDDIVALHSLALTKHHYKRLAELDFVLVGRGAIAVLEVKGGGVSVSEGVWRFEDRYREIHKSSEGPFNQARSGMYSLRDRLIDRFSLTEIRDVAFGYGVVLPESDFCERSPEWDLEMVIDDRKLRSVGLDRAVRDLERYWQDKHGNRPAASGRLMARIQDYLRPDFEMVPTLVNLSYQVMREQVRLTDQQIHHLDLIADNDRILCEGGAGTGKTFIALEVARRHAAAGDTVLLTCRSPNLASFLRARVPHEGVLVYAMDDIPNGAGPFDVLVVDEGQDLMTQDRVLRVGSHLKGDLDRGRWRIFLDSNNQSGMYGDFDHAALEILLDTRPVQLRLSENCRNTESIVIQTKLMTGADLGTAAFGAGPPVDWAYFVERDEAAGLLAGKIRSLINDGVPPGDITILSPVRRIESIASELPSRVTMDLHDLSTVEEFVWPVQSLSYSTIADFKGLENGHVLLVDLESLGGSDEVRSEVYVAMSRPRVSLWILLHESLQQDRENLERQHVEGVVADVAPA